MHNNVILDLCHTKEDFDFVYENYLNDFPYDERKSKNKLIEMLKTGKYKLYIIKPTNNKDLILGYIFVIDCADLVFMDYISIIKAYRNKGYGSKALEVLKNKYKNGCIIFEIESSNNNKNSIEYKRKCFYLRNGAKIVNVNYALPIPDEKIKFMNMNLMVLPSNNFTYNKDEFRKFIESSVLFIHSDYKHTNEVINLYINNFPESI